MSVSAKKRKSIDGIIIGFDEIKNEDGILRHTVMYTKEGNPSVIFQMQNPVLKFNADASQYYAFIDVLKNILQTLGEGYSLQKQDILTRERYHADVKEDDDILNKCYFGHFEGREYMVTQTFLVITQEFKKNKFLAFDPKKFKEFLSKADKVETILKSSRISYFKLGKEQMDEYLHRYVAFSFNSGHFSMNNIVGTDEFLKMGDSAVKCVPLVDIDNVQLPQLITPCSSVKTNGLDTPVDSLSFLADIPYATSIVYNQTFIIPFQRREKMMLERKAKRHSSMPDPANKVAQADIETVLDIIAREGSMIVHSNFNIMYRAPLNRVSNVNNFIQTKIYENGLGKSSSSSYNQFELFMASCPGCSYSFKDYDLFTCLTDVALCLTYKECDYHTEDSRLLIHVTDRRGIPIGIDFTGKECNPKITDNGNFFVFGPSGSGKSFTMCSIVRQLYDQDTDIVLIDVGDSYSNLNDIKIGRYITYSKDNPISMNPFNISPVEYEENFGEKKNFLISLIFLLYKGNQVPDKIEESIINQVLVEYYEAYFSPFEAFTESERKSWRKKLVLDDKIAGTYDESADAFIKSDDPEGIDIDLENFDVDSIDLDSLDEMADLSDEEKEKQEKILDRANKFRNVINDKAASEGEKDAARNQLMRIVPEIVNGKRYLVKLEKRIDAMEEKKRKLKVKSLSFNSFFEFSLQRIPQIMVELDKGRFNIRDYKKILERFYKGGEFEDMLNSDIDSTLFDEKFIVFEIDKIKDDTVLFPIVVLIIMDVFLQKMRIKKGRKALIIEEAWKAISSPTMAGYIKYLWKTVRKFNGIAGVVTQEIADLTSSEIVKDAIIANSDVKVILDQSKFKDRFEITKEILGLSDSQVNQILTINALDNREGRSRFNEICIIRKDVTMVVGIEEPKECYWAYTTERSEKEALKIYREYYKDPLVAIQHIEKDRRKAEVGTFEFSAMVNQYNTIMKLWK